MSNQGAEERPDLVAHARLRVAVERLLELVRLQGDRAVRAEGRVRDLEGLLARFARGEEDPARLARGLEALREENEELRRRLGEGAEGVERLLARIRFLEEHGR